MGVPLAPLAAAYGLGLGHLAGHAFHQRFMAPSAGASQLMRWSHPSRTVGIKASGARTSTAQTMRSSRSRTRTRTSTSRRRFVRRRRFLRRRRDLQPFSVMRKLKTVIALSHDSGAGLLSMTPFRLNSANDPSGTLSAAQPLGFDQWAALYRRYCVVGWSVKVECVTADNSNPVVLGFTATTESTALASYSHYKESPSTVSLIVSPDQDKARFFARGGVKRWFLPRGGRMLGDDTLSALTITEPGKLLYGHLWSQVMDATSDPGVVRFVVTLYQSVVFSDPIVPSRS